MSYEDQSEDAPRLLAERDRLKAQLAEDDRRKLRALMSVIEEGVHRGVPIDGPFVAVEPLPPDLPGDSLSSARIHALPWDDHSIKRIFEVIRIEARKRYLPAAEYEAIKIKRLEEELDMVRRSLYAEVSKRLSEKFSVKPNCTECWRHSNEGKVP